MKTPVSTVINFILDHPGTYDRQIRKALGIRWLRDYEDAIRSAGYDIVRQEVFPGSQKTAIYLSTTASTPTASTPAPPDMHPSDLPLYFEIRSTANGHILASDSGIWAYQGPSSRKQALAQLASLLDASAPDTPALNISVLLKSSNRPLTIK